jgi:phosphate transport system ATP-binding protein
MTEPTVGGFGPACSPDLGEGRAVPGETPKIVVEDFTASFFGKSQLRRISLEIFRRERLAIIGPSGGGKTTFLRALNRLNDLEHGFSKTGRILIDGEDIYGKEVDVPALRRRVGMVYATPVPLPRSIYENIVFGPRLAGEKEKARLDYLVESSLKDSYLWEEVKDRLRTPAHNLSGGQQQRLCLARILALEPEVLLLDEPCSGLDPISTAKIEDALDKLREKYSIVLVTNNTKQAARASERTAFFLMGEMIEIGPTQQIFTTPAHQRTNDYITGRFG